jgi:hypothetical protein
MAAPAPLVRRGCGGVTIWGDEMQLSSTITCPACGHRSTEEMPEDACRYFYDCKSCGMRMKPKPGDCCVLCSFGDVPCPPVQEARAIGRPDVDGIENR